MKRFFAWLGLFGAIGLLEFWYRYLEILAGRNTEPALKPFINEMSGAFSGGVLFLGVLWLVRWRPLVSPVWARRLPLYLGALLLYSATCTSMMWGLRSFFYPLAGFGPYDYGVMPLRYFMELPLQAIVFTIMVAGISAAAAFRAAREREVRAAQLESSLARSQLRSLRLQLQPHFLFNALNTISSTMYRDPSAADEMLEQLSGLLRASLRTAQTDEVTLEEELEALDCYLGIMRARFGERLQVERRVEPQALGVQVPSMILQPLVENAIRHGNAERLGKGRIEIRASVRGDALTLEVEDDGPGAPSGSARERSGTGLSATAERLQLLYGEKHRFEVGNVAGGGFIVRTVLPLRAALESPATAPAVRP
jgi:two-component system LytT family sensor kinase